MIEVISEGDVARKRDLQDKRANYAKEGVPEYWIIDPFEKAVIVLRLVGSDYELHGRFSSDQTATSATLNGFRVTCSDIWALERKTKTI